MLNLTSKKYYFFGVSLLIIVLGVAAIAAWGLNPGIDFTGGTTVDLQFQNTLPTSASTTISSLFKSEVGAKDVKIYFSKTLNTDKSQIFWLQMNVPVDTNVQGEILKRLQAQSSTLGTVQ
jgi:preprotein translocase subunit SecF